MVCYRYSALNYTRKKTAIAATMTVIEQQFGTSHYSII
jgi:hypothetical protein